MLIRLIYWFWFGLTLALLPVAISFSIICMRHSELSFFQNLTNCVTKGELFIVCTAVLGVNIGDLFKDATSPGSHVYKFCLVGASILMALFTCGIYIAITTSSDPMPAGSVAKTSLYSLGVTSLICIFSIFLPRVKS